LRDSIKRILFFVLCVLVSGGFVAAQEGLRLDSPAKPRPYDFASGIGDQLRSELAGFRKFDWDKLSASLSASYPNAAISLYKTDYDGADVEYSPNPPITFNFAVGFNGLCLLGGYGSRYNENQYEIRTTSLDFQGFYYNSFSGIDIYYQKYDGFYIDNLDYDAGNSYPSMRIETETLNAYLRLSGRASLRSMVVPAALSSEYPRFSALGSIKISSVCCALGGMLFLQAWGFYLIPSLSVGFGYPFVSSDVSLKSPYQIKVNGKVNVGLSLERFTLGMFVCNDSEAITDSGTDETLQFHSIDVEAYGKILF
jgi:hypothetical protein